MAKLALNKLSNGSNSATTVTSSSPVSVVAPQDIDKLLRVYARYIPHLVRNLVPRNHILPGELNDEINDISQGSLIKFWRRLISDQPELSALTSYVSRIVFSQCMDVARQNKRKPLQMSENQEEELFQGNVLLFSGEDTGDPALEYERRELIEEVLDDVVQLPPIQMKAMICLLKDEVGDTFPLTEAFAKYGVDIQSTVWPDDRYERQKLRSSLSAARKKLRSLKPKYALV